ncbi:MAG: hypothetical protein L6R41_002455 [Letrouitia leprolyta]|nr:MAG: hypothetical protein L6R41_002455 [Letrouitia leprolyta]
MSATPRTCRITTVLVRNIHCTSCVSYIKDVLSNFAQETHNINISLLRQTVQVQHRSSLPPQEICLALAHSAFDVLSFSTKDNKGEHVEELDLGSLDGWLETVLERLNSPRSSRALGDHPFAVDFRFSRNVHHVKHCEACRAEESIETAPTTSLEETKAIQLGSMKPRRGQMSNDSDSTESLETPKPSGTMQVHILTILIGGMTCASCSSAVTAALEELEYVSKVEVSLLTNSAMVEYTGPEDKSGSIISTVEDVGFEASIAESKQRNLMASKPSTSRLSQQETGGYLSPTKTIKLYVDGMFCKNCPSRVTDRLQSTFPHLLQVEEPPSIKTPILTLSYKPSHGSLTIRDIVSTINEIDGQFSARVYHPPSLEDRSQVMQAQERKGLLLRLLLCCSVILPTFLVGVLWMSIVPPSNPKRQYFEEPMWVGMVSRAQWALLILATPIMFFAADVFHVRAFKEIRALWRPKSQVPILRRFYRFGSMSLLISAGTSVAYFSSLALLVKGATTSANSSMHSTTYFDSVVFLTFFILCGKFLEAYSKAKTGSAVAMLGKLRPQEAILVNLSETTDAGSELSDQSTRTRTEKIFTSNTQRISVDLLEIGDIVIVPRGSSPPADGSITMGSSKFNESSLTGESRDVNKIEGDQVFAGTVNVGNPVQVEITGLGGTSMLDQIMSVVREGQSKRAPVERVVDAITGYFVPVITALAIITFVIWFGLGQSGALSSKYLNGQQGGWAFWSLEFAIAVFVVACPCGIGLAAPTALFVGGGLAAKNGILVRGGGEAFQEASRVDAVVFDKTGTLTEGGKPIVTDDQILAEGEISKYIWSIVAGLEETSLHPLARALLSHASTRSKPQITAQNIIEEPGHGLRGTFTIATGSDTTHTYEAAIGSETFIESLQKPSPLNYYTTTTLSNWKSQSKSVALVALRRLPINIDDDASPQPWTLAALFAISDPIRPSAFPTITALQARGLSVYMLTGDNPATASAVASTLSIPADHVFAGVLPTQKAEKIEWLKKNAPRRSSSSRSFLSMFQRKHDRTSSHDNDKQAIIAFVGDGINDAPALTAASVSIAISSSTSANDIAISSASFILLSPSLGTLLTLFDLSTLVFRRIKFNFCWALVYNVVLVPVAAGALFWIKEGGWKLSPVWGSLAMAGSSLSVVCSSLAMGWSWKGGIKEWIGKR